MDRQLRAVDWSIPECATETFSEAGLSTHMQIGSARADVVSVHHRMHVI